MCAVAKVPAPPVKPARVSAVVGKHKQTPAVCTKIAQVPSTVVKPENSTIGIFNLPLIHAVPLEPEILSKVDKDDIVTEELRFTSAPGVRVFAYLSYPLDKKTHLPLKNLPTNITVRYRGSESRRGDAKVGFVGFSLSAPSGNTDTTIKETIGGPPFEQDFVDDPTQSWVYHHVVALTRAIDYLCTRPEVDPKRIAVNGYSWAGYVTAVLHAIDNRPCVYNITHGTGYFADDDGISGDKPSLLKTRKYYDMYAPSAYAKYGTQPIFIATALTDYFATLDGLMCMCTNLKSPMRLSLAPNRYHAFTARNEFRGSGYWNYYWQGTDPGRPAPPKVTDGTVSTRAGHLIYTFSAKAGQPIDYAEVMYSFGKPGHWTGRTWHRKAATKTATGYEFEIPVYDPAIPCYAVAQIETKDFGGIANMVQFIEPAKFGITQPTAIYPKMLFDFEDGSDLYIPEGTVGFTNDAPEGKQAASIKPFQDGTVQFLNIEPFFWTGAKELRFFLKGDDKPGPVNVYLVYDTSYWLDNERKNYTKVTLVPDDKVFPGAWKEYSVSLDTVTNADKIDCLFFEVGNRPLLIDAIRWQ